MSDIVTRLQRHSAEWLLDETLLTDAADEIERLRAYERQVEDFRGHFNAATNSEGQRQNLKPGVPPIRSFAEFRDCGLLWLINTVVFHPRGFAIGFRFDDERHVVGWGLQGNGTEPWHFDTEPPTDEERAKYGWQSVDELFAKVEALFEEARRA